MASNPNDTITITPHDSGSSAPLSHADTYAARAAEALADADSYFLEGMSLLDDPSGSETRAPADQTGEGTAPTTRNAPTNAGRAEQGPETNQNRQRPAAADAPSIADTEGTTPTPDGQPDPRTENNRRRADSQQSILLSENNGLKARLAAMEEQNRQLLHDNRVLFGQHETVRETARRQGAIRFEDVDQALTDSAARENQQRAAEAQQAAQAQQALQQQSAGWQAAIGERTTFGTTAREQAIGAIFEAALETGTKITRADAEQYIKDGYNDPGVLSDIKLWRSKEISNALANERIGNAFARIAEMAKQKMVRQAVAEMRGEQPDIPIYNREQAYGGADAGPADTRRTMTYQQRVAADLAAANDMFDGDLRRLTASTG